VSFCSRREERDLVDDSRGDVGHLEQLLDLSVLHTLTQLGKDVLDLSDGDESRVLLVEHLESFGELG